MIKEMNSLKTMGALITKEADSMSAMKFRVNKAGKAMWREGNTEDTGRWCNRVFFTHVKAGGGAKKRLTCYMVGNAGIWIL